MTEDKNRFFVVAQEGAKHFAGTIQLPSGSKYSGRIFSNEGPTGTWYRADLVAADHDRHAQDTRIDAAKKPEGLDPRSTIKPLELRLNPWTGGKAHLIGNLWTSEGLFVVFANKVMHEGKPALAGSIRPARLEPDATAARNGAQQRAAEGGAPTLPTSEAT